MKTPPVVTRSLIVNQPVMEVTRLAQRHPSFANKVHCRARSTTARHSGHVDNRKCFSLTVRMAADTRARGGE